MWVSSDGVHGLEVLLNLDAVETVEVVTSEEFGRANSEEGTSFFSEHDLVLVARQHSGHYAPLARIPAQSRDGQESTAYELAKEVMADFKEIMLGDGEVLDMDALVVKHGLAKFN